MCQGKQKAEELQKRNQRQSACSSSETMERKLCDYFIQGQCSMGSECPDVHSCSPYWMQASASGTAATIVGPVQATREAPIRSTTSGAARRHANMQKFQARAMLRQAQAETPHNVNISIRPCHSATAAPLPAQSSRWADVPVTPEDDWV